MHDVANEEVKSLHDEITWKSGSRRDVNPAARETGDDLAHGDEADEAHTGWPCVVREEECIHGGAVYVMA